MNLHDEFMIFLFFPTVTEYVLITNNFRLTY